MYATWFGNTWDYYPPQYRVGLEVNRSTLFCRLYWLKLQHPWPWSNTPYIAKEPPSENPCFESTDNAPNKKPHLRLINLICVSPI